MKLYPSCSGMPTSHTMTSGCRTANQLPGQLRRLGEGDLCSRSRSSKRPSSSRASGFVVHDQDVGATQLPAGLRGDLGGGKDRGLARQQGQRHAKRRAATFTSALGG
jgi:hypothetical protein